MVCKLRRTTLWLCFSLIICLSVWQLITGPGPPQSQFAPNIIADHSDSFEYPMHIMPISDYTRLIDLNKFEFTILNTSCNETSPLLLIIIFSAPSNVHRRNVIRQTWGQKMDNVVLLFALGKVSKKWEYWRRRLHTENVTYGDFIQGNFEDSYKNLTYKHAMVFKYAIYHCPSAKYILKIDDDVFINLVVYMEWLQEELTLHGVRDLLFCRVMKLKYPQRSYRSKWRVSFDDYTKIYYPDYCNGAGAILYSSASLFKLYTELQKAKYFWIDDVLITGILRENVNLTLQDSSDWVIPSYFFQDSLHQLYPRKPFLFGRMQLCAELIWKLWNYTMKHNKSKPFHYNLNHN